MNAPIERDPAASDDVRSLEIEDWNLRHEVRGEKARNTSRGTIFTDEAGAIVRLTRIAEDMGANPEDGSPIIRLSPIPTRAQLLALPSVVCRLQFPLPGDEDREASQTLDTLAGGEVLHEDEARDADDRLAAAEVEPSPSEIGDQQCPECGAEPFDACAPDCSEAVAAREAKSADLGALLFINPELAPPGEAQVTVRRGDKWSGSDGIELPVMRADTPGDNPEPPVAFARIIRTIEFALKDVPQEALDIEHDPACRTPEGLLKAMDRAYPGITPDEGVTVVVFETLPPVDADAPPVTQSAAPVTVVPAVAGRDVALGGPGVIGEGPAGA